jgi:hypothetical protein
MQYCSLNDICVIFCVGANASRKEVSHIRYRGVNRSGDGCYDEARELRQLEFCSWAVGLYVEVAAAVHPSTPRAAFEDQVQAIRRTPWHAP